MGPHQSTTASVDASPRKPLESWTSSEVRHFLRRDLRLSLRSTRRLGGSGARLSEISEAELREALTRRRVRHSLVSEEAARTAAALAVLRQEASRRGCADEAGAAKPRLSVVPPTSDEWRKTTREEKVISGATKALPAALLLAKGAPKAVELLRGVENDAVLHDVARGLGTALHMVPAWLIPVTQLAAAVMQRATQARANRQSCISLALVVGKLADTLCRAPKPVLALEEANVQTIEDVMAESLELVSQFAEVGWLQRWLRSSKDARMFTAWRERLTGLMSVLQLDLQFHQAEVLNADVQGKDDHLLLELVARAGIDPSAKDSTDQALQALLERPEVREWLAGQLGIQTTLLHSELAGIARDLQDIKQDLNLVVKKLSGGAGSNTVREPLVRVPPRNKDFFGREDLLQAVESDLIGAGNVGISHTVLSGLGGVGKTQVAVEYAHRHAKRYNLVWWVPAEEQTSAMNSLTELAQVLGLNILELVLPQVLGYLRSHKDWLLIFDNVESPDGFIRNILPEHGSGGHVIITTRSGSLWPRCLPLEPFGGDEAAAMLMKVTGRNDAEEAKVLADELGHLPLAVGLAAAYIRRYNISCSEYRARFNDARGAKLLSWRPMGADKSMAASVKMSLQCLDTSALQWLRCAAFMESDHIRPGMLAGLVDDAEEAVVSLGDHSLVRVQCAESGSLAVHRLVQRVVRDSMDADERATVLTSLLDTCRVDASEPSMELWNSVKLEAPHALRIMRWCAQYGIRTDDVALCAERYYKFFMTMWRQWMGAPFATLVLELAVSKYGEGHLKVADAQGMLAFAILHERLQEAFELVSQRLAIVTEACGEDSVEHAEALAQLGELQLERFDPIASRNHLMKAVPILRVAAHEHQDEYAMVAGRAMFQTARALALLGEAQPAKDILVEALERGSCCMGQGFNPLPFARGMMGLVECELGETDESKKHLLENLAAMEALFGKDHFKVAVSKAQLVRTLFYSGDQQGAKDLLVQIEDTLSRTQGSCAPESSRIFVSLARFIETHFPEGACHRDALLKAAKCALRKAFPKPEEQRVFDAEWEVFCHSGADISMVEFCEHVRKLCDGSGGCLAAKSQANPQGPPDEDEEEEDVR